MGIYANRTRLMIASEIAQTHQDGMKTLKFTVFFLYKELTSFVESAKKYNAKECERDIVEEYLQFSGGCHEIVDLIKILHNVSAKDAPVLLNALTCILVRIANDMKEYSKLGLDIVAETLNYGLKTMCNFVKGNQKPARIRAVLNLLASMIAQGSGAARDVFSKANVAGPSFLHLLSRSNPNEEEDIRALFLNLIVLLLTVGDNGLIRQVVDTKGFLNRIFPNLMYDKADVIVLLLQTFSSKVLNNPSIMKTSKIRLFNDFTLKYVLELYSWSGPLKPRQFLKRKLGDDDVLQPMKVADEDITAVREAAHAFMITLCCSYKYGIIFRDLTYGTSGRNQNHILTNLLKPFTNPYADSHMSELVISVLKACPDQMKYYLPELKFSFTPRLSSQWLKAIDFIKKILQTQDCVSCLFRSEEKKTIPKLVPIFKVICIPEVINSSQFLETLQKLHPYVCYHLLDYLLCVLKQVKTVFDYCVAIQEGNNYSHSELEEFHRQCTSYVLTAIPDVKNLEKYWHRITSLSVHDLSYQAECTESLKGFVMPNAAALLAQVLDLVNVYGELFRDAFENTDATFYSLFTGLKECKLQLSSDEISSLQFKLMDFFAFEGLLKKADWNEKLGFPLFSFVLDSYLSVRNFKLAAKIEKHISKLIKNSTSFDGELWEVTIWTRELKFQKKRHSQILVKFLTDVVHTLGPVAEKSSSETSKGFSNLVPAALLHLLSVSDKVCGKYVQCVINKIFHRQLQPQTLLSCVKQHKELFSSSLFSYWELLCNIDETIEVPEKTRNESLNIALQDAFVLFHSISNRKVTHSDIYFCHMTDKIEEVCYEQIRDLIWQLLTYVKLEAEKLFVTAEYITAVPSYVFLLRALVTHGETLEKGEAIAESSNDTCKHTGEMNEWMVDLLTHPVITSFFLPSDISFSQCNDHMVLVIRTVSDFVFEFIKLRLINDKSEIIMQLKNKAVSFCIENIVPELSADTKVDYKWEIFEKTVNVFASVITASEAVLLLNHLLSLEDSLFKQLDPKGCVFSILIQIYALQAENLLLPRKILKMVFTKAVQPNQKKKLGLIMKENVMKLLKLHPSYALDFPRRCLQTLMEQWSTSSLEILDALIANNTSVLKNIQTVVISYLNSESINDESFLFHIIVRCLKAKFDAEKDDQFLQSVCKFIWAYICHVLISEVSHELNEPFSFEDIPYVVDLMMQNSVIGKDEILAAVQELHDKSLVEIPHVSKIVTLLKLLNLWFRNSSISSDLSPLILNLLVNWVECALQITYHEDRDTFLSSVLNDALIHVKETDVTVVKGVFSDTLKWHSFVQHSLKVALRDVSVGAQLITFLNAFIEKLYSTPVKEVELESRNEEISKIYHLLSSHSNFCAVLLDDSGQYKPLKGCTVQLLITLVQMNSSVCQNTHVPVFLASYNATLSDTDQKLLYLLKLYEDRDIDFTSFSPFLWGTAAISHYSLQKKGKYSLWRKPKMQEVLGLFQRDLLEYTLQNFPLNLGLEPLPATAVEPDTVTLWEKVYDPRFVLPLLSVILSPGAYVNCRGFIESNVLAVIFGSLSSYDKNIRAIGYYCLAQFYSHLESSMYGQSKIWMSLLDSVRNSIDGSNPRVPSIITLFLTKAVNILINPGNSMYVAIYKFLMAKPNLDLGQVPEFYKLFNSIEIEHRIQRNWILTLLEEGLRTSLDFHICQKRYIFTILLPYYCSSLSNEQEKIKILQIILSIVKIYSSARTMCQSGLLTWMHNVINLSNESEILKLISKIMDTLWATCKPSSSADASLPPLYSSFPTEFQLVHLSLLKKLAALKQSQS